MSLMDVSKSLSLSLPLCKKSIKCFVLFLKKDLQVMLMHTEVISPLIMGLVSRIVSSLNLSNVIY